MNQNNKYFKYVAKDKRLLMFGDSLLEEFADIFNSFNQVISQEILPFTIENLSATINDFNIDIIVITAKQNDNTIPQILSNIKDYKDLHVMLYCNQDGLNFNENLINISDVIFTKKISKKNLQEKIYNLISDKIASSYIDSSSDELQNNRVRYKDAFDIEVMFLAEDLKNISKAIGNGDISQEVFDKLKKNISKVSSIVNNYLMSSKAIKRIIKELDEYLNNFDLDSVDITHIEGFEYLSNLIEDLAVFLDKYFITKEMENMYIIEDSLKNSFEYVKLVFEGKHNSDDDNSEMEFF